ncbi:MAG: antitoxin VapB family protein [Candidatus Kariarchaeaceae archaeon]|jgi:predicted CopG family antitoxin
MGTKNISIKDDAYLALKSLQLRDESFSDTILRLSEYFGNISESFGAGTKTQREYEEELINLEKQRISMSEGREI